jgi:hypothetical protein
MRSLERHVPRWLAVLGLIRRALVLHGRRAGGRLAPDDRRRRV